MAYRVEITRRAEADLEELYLWVVDRAPQQGARWFNGLERAPDSRLPPSKYSSERLGDFGKLTGGIFRPQVHVDGPLLAGSMPGASVGPRTIIRARRRCQGAQTTGPASKKSSQQR